MAYLLYSTFAEILFRLYRLNFKSLRDLKMSNSIVRGIGGTVTEIRAVGHIFVMERFFVQSGMNWNPQV